MRRFLDTSACFKLYVPEPNSATVQGEASQASSLVISELTLLEMRSALAGLVRRGTLTVADGQATLALFLLDVTRYEVLPVDGATLVTAGRLLDVYGVSEGLRPLDAIQLAGALSTGSLEALITTDHVQAVVARLEGMKVVP